MATKTPSLSERLRKKDLKWVQTEELKQFVKDHREGLLAHSERITIPSSTMDKLEYRLMDFLKSIKRDPSMEWIVKYLNSIETSMDFRDKRSLLIPSIPYMEKLYSEFKTLTT